MICLSRLNGQVFALNADLIERVDATPDTQVLADLAELSTALALWSGTKPEQVLHHLRRRADDTHQAQHDWSSTARRAEASFPNDIAASLAGEQPVTSSSRPDPPRPSPGPRLM